MTTADVSRGERKTYTVAIGTGFNDDDRENTATLGDGIRMAYISMSTAAVLVPLSRTSQVASRKGLRKLIVYALGLVLTRKRAWNGA